MTQAATPRCWAYEFSPCRGPISREHILSKGLFREKVVRLSGPAWCNGEEGVVPIARLTAKILCAGHNSALSELDTAAIDVRNAMRRLGDLRQLRRVRTNDRRPWSPVELTVDGVRFERWMLKTMVNVVSADRRGSSWRPPRDLVETIFEPHSQGLFAGLGLVEKGALVDEQLHVQTVMQTDGGPAAIALSFSGYPFVCSWSIPRPEFGGVLSWNGEPVDRMDVRWKVDRMVDGEGTSLRFDWSGNWRARDNRRVVALRGRFRPQA